MTNSELEILLSLKDEVSGRLANIEKLTGRSTQAMKQNWLKVSAAIVLVTLGLKKLIEATKKTAAALITVGSVTESYRVRMTTLLGTLEEGNKVFADMTELAGQVPKTYDEIMRSATNLSAVVRGGSEEIKSLMPIIVDLASGTGMSVQEVTGQMIRMYSAGAASADMFRERGVLAALGFQAGVSTSAEETMKTITEQWADGTGKFVGASEALASTWIGMMSMMEDAWFQFKGDIGEGLFAEVKVHIAGLLSLIKKAKEEGGEYNVVVDELNNLLVEAFNKAKELMFTMVVNAGTAINVWNDLRLMVGSVVMVMYEAIAFSKEAGRDLADALGLKGDHFLGAERYQEELTEIEGIIAQIAEINAEVAEKSVIDYNKLLEDKLVLVGRAVKKEVNIIKKAELDKAKAIIDADKKVTANKAANSTLRKKFEQDRYNQFKAILSSAAQDNKAAAIAMKAIKIGEAVMNTAVGVTQALAAYAPPVSWILAGITAAMGAAEVAIIASQGFAQGTDTVPAMLSPGEMVFPSTMADAIRKGDISVSGRNRFSGGGTSVINNIEIYNPVIDSTENIDALVEEISQRLTLDAER